MSTIDCPCCRASNTTGPNCRRCSADLSLLFQLEARREYLIASVQKKLREQNATAALPLLAEAEQLRPGREIAELRATAHLLNRDFAAAFVGHRAAQS